MCIVRSGYFQFVRQLTSSTAVITQSLSSRCKFTCSVVISDSDLLAPQLKNPQREDLTCASVPTNTSGLSSGLRVKLFMALSVLSQKALYPLLGLVAPMAPPTQSFPSARRQIPQTHGMHSAKPNSAHAKQTPGHLIKCDLASDRCLLVHMYKASERPVQMKCVRAPVPSHALARTSPAWVSTRSQFLMCDVCTDRTPNAHNTTHRDHSVSQFSSMEDLCARSFCVTLLIAMTLLQSSSFLTSIEFRSIHDSSNLCSHVVNFLAVFCGWTQADSIPFAATLEADKALVLDCV